MTDPFAMLSTQATQMAGFFENINANSQRMFANKFAVQEAQSRLAQSTISSMETMRVNDQQIANMKLQAQHTQMRIDADKADSTFTDKLRPLKYQADKALYESQIMNRAAEQIQPYMQDIRNSMSSLVFDNPELSQQAQDQYNSAVGAIVRESLSNPEMDMPARILQEKQKMHKWVQDKKAQKPVVDGYNWVKGLFTQEDQKPQFDLGQAASTYRFFGGDDKTFLQKYDPKIQKNIEAATMIAEATGQIDKESLAMMPPEAQQKVLQGIKDKKNQSELFAAINENNKALATLIRAKVDGDTTNDEMITFLSNKHKTLINAVTRMYPDAIAKDGAPSPDGSPRPLSQNTLDVLGAQPSQSALPNAATGDNGNIENDEQIWNAEQGARFQKISNILGNLVDSDEGKKELNELQKSIAMGEKHMTLGAIEDYVNGASEKAIQNLVLQKYFQDHITANKLDKTTGGPSVASTPQFKLKSDIYAITNNKSSAADKKSAIKSLKLRLPRILLDYANQ